MAENKRQKNTTHFGKICPMVGKFCAYGLTAGTVAAVSRVTGADGNMTGYTPTTDDVETAFHEFASNLETKCPGSYEEAPEFSDWKQAMYGFRRWYADVIRKAKDEAWGEGYEAGCEDMENGGNATRNPYTEEP